MSFVTMHYAVKHSTYTERHGIVLLMVTASPSSRATALQHCKH